MRTGIVPPLLAFLFVLPACEETINQTLVEGYPSPLYAEPLPFDAQVFQQRRDELMRSIPQDEIVFITTNDIYTRNGDITYTFHPAPTFYYLTGFEEPNALAVVRHAPASSESELIMFVEERTPGEIQWIGPVYGISGAVSRFGADSAYDIDAWAGIVESYLSDSTVTAVHANLDENEEVRLTFNGIVPPSTTIYDVRSTAYDLRLVKSAGEIDRIRRAVRISVQAFQEAIPRVKPLMFEHEVEAIFDLVFRINGCSGTAFPSIIASGPNITTLHYDANMRQMEEGDQVMIDIGAEYDFYSADVTRTLPVDGSFSYEEGVVYDIVRKAHDAVLASAIPGASYYALFGMQRDMIIDEMILKGIITGTRNDIVQSGRYRQYIPAGFGHSIGLDVHDPWLRDANNDKILRENMVLAIEPHIYLNPDDGTVAPPYRGVSARIEDDILITSTGPKILSAELPRGREELERMMSGR